MASWVLDEGYSAEPLRRITAGSRRVSCDSRWAKTAAVYPPSPSPALLPILLPSLLNIKGCLWHGLGRAGRLAGAAALRAISGLILHEHPTAKLESHQPRSFISVILVYLPVLLSDTQHAGLFASVSVFLEILCHMLCNGWMCSVRDQKC